MFQKFDQVLQEPNFFFFGGGDLGRARIILNFSLLDFRKIIFLTNMINFYNCSFIPFQQFFPASMTGKSADDEGDSSSDKVKKPKPPSLVSGTENINMRHVLIDKAISHQGTY